jgi:urea transport system substrate-binding protein
MTVPETDRPFVASGPPAAARPGRALPTLIGLTLLAALGWLVADRLLVDRSPVVVGLLHSRSGPAAAGERSLLDAEVLALEQLNRAGGLLGRSIRWVVADGGSDSATLAREAERLIRRERVSVIFGCGSAPSRRSVLPVVEANDHLLVFPGPHEGFERSPHVFSTGATPNQQVAPAVQWCRDALAARRFVIVSGQGLWPRCVAAVAADQVTALGGDIAGEPLLAEGDDGEEAVRVVEATRPDVVLCALGGADTIRFVGRLRAAGLDPERTPVITFGLGEDDLRGSAAGDLAGTYAAAGYFQSLDRAENLVFVRGFKNRFGEDRVTDAGAAAAGDAVRLWAQAVRAAGTAEPRQVRHALRHQSLDAPEGVVAVDPDTQHVWRPAYVGRLRADGQFDLVWSSRMPLRPEPFPATRSRRSWDGFVEDLRRGPAKPRGRGATAAAIPPRPAEARRP